MRFLVIILLTIIGFALTARIGHAADGPLPKYNDEPEINFSRDIRPILSDKCFHCHGPDEEGREADLRLDLAKDANDYAFVPNSLDDSDAWQRIISLDEDEIMPPVDHKNPLAPKEIALLKTWIEQGAPYKNHWAFEPVKQPEAPKTEQATANEVDRFVAARLDQEGLTFSPAASAATLYRRLHLDLTGLPPKLKNLDEFLADPSEEAYQATIDRLMESGAFAERMAMEWLDVARYADTNGYSIDDHRDMWAWRDWVIDSFQNNQSYDEFIRHQIAGDLLENASERTRIATGFLRNSMNTHEGGTIAEEYRVASVADKIDVVSTAFLGLTMKCAQCHDHKYDEISQRDYYRFFAFFNTSTEPGRGGVNGNTKPFMDVQPILQSKEEFQAAIKSRVTSLEFLRTRPEEFLGDARQQWERATLAAAEKKTKPQKIEPDRPVVQFPIPEDDEAKGLSWIWSHPSGLGEFAWFRKTFTIDKLPAEAKLYVSCDNEAVVWVNGMKLGFNPDWRTPSVLDLKPLLIKGENLIAIAGKDWEKGKVKAALVAAIALPDRQYIVTDDSWLVSDKELPGWNQTGEVKGFVGASVVATHGDAPWGLTFSRLGAAVKNPKTDLVLDRKTPILIRGQYDQHGENVSAGIPELFSHQSVEGGAGEGKPKTDRKLNRLDLADWLTDPANPLTARVTVNRYWQMLFGTGLVKTTEDFGSQGEWPSHPALLDYLSAKFVASGWDVRALLKEMLLSQAYRQSSTVTPALLEKDPYNRLLARAPRYRLSAEAIRDGAFATGGLLTQKLGGPSVYPPQPYGLWKEVSHFGHSGFFSAQHFFTDHEVSQVYRRSLYTFWKRTSPPPVMATFDAPSRETCAVRRSRTNTPLQALVLMNEPQFVEASYGLAKRMLASSDQLDDQIRIGFRLATARFPTEEETSVLRSSHARQLTYFEASSDRARAYVSDRGDANVAAMMSVASLILNLDETITRE